MILYYPGNKENRTDTIRSLLPDEEILEIGDESLYHTIDELMAMEPGSALKEPGSHDEFLFFGNADREKLQKLDRALAEGGVQIRHKAVKTEHNGSWQLETLLQEIEKEAAYFRKREKLYHMVSHPNMERIGEDEAYMKTMAAAYAILQAADADEKTVDLAIQAIEEMENKKAS